MKHRQSREGHSTPDLTSFFGVFLLTILSLASQGCTAEDPAGSTAASATQEEPTSEHAEADEPHWSYDGDTGPAFWGSLSDAWTSCASGEEQSPIDIVGLIDQDLPDLAPDYAATPLTIVHNGHTVQVDHTDGSHLLVGNARYRLLQFHFHTPSEHTIDGRSYPLEMHLVHADDQGRLAVLGVLFEVGEAHAGLAALAANLPAPHETTTVDGATINADALLPADLGYVRYDGSLTTPPCSEGVAWHVVQATQTVSAEQLAAFVERIPSSNRPTKEVGARTLARDST